MKSQQEVKEAARILQRELQKRFKKFTDPAAFEYNPLFAMATALDPRYRVILKLQSAKNRFSRKCIKQECVLLKTCNFLWLGYTILCGCNN